MRQTFITVMAALMICITAMAEKTKDFAPDTATEQKEEKQKPSLL